MLPGSPARRGGWGCRPAILAACLGVAAAPPVAGQPEGDTWRELAPLPTPRRLLAAAAEGGRLYTFGGCGSPCFGPPAHVSTLEETRVEVYDPATDAWQVRGPIPAVFFGGAAAAPGDGRIYLLGGFLTGDRLLEYDPAGDAWRSRAPMPTSRHGLAAVALGGKIYALGGSDGRRASAAVEIYDPDTDTWRRGAPLPTPREFLAAAAAGGRIYAVGGSPDCCGESQTAAVEVYDPAADRWSAAAPLPEARQVSAAAAVEDKLYVLGGFVPGAGVQEETFEYDPSTDAWVVRAAMPGDGRDQAPAVALDGRILVPGGSVDCHCRALGDHHEYTPPQRPRADLAIHLTAEPRTVRAGQGLTYTILVQNLGPDAVLGARVRDAFPARLDRVSWTCSAIGDARCPGSRAAPVPGDLDELVDLPAAPAGEHAVLFTVTATVTAADSCPPAREIQNTARVDPPQGVQDPNPVNNSASRSVAVRVEVDVAVSKAVAPAAAGTGDSVAFEILVTNGGPDIACGARVRDAFPARLDRVSWTCTAIGDARCPGSRAAPVPGDLDELVDLPAAPAGEHAVLFTVTAAVTAADSCPPEREIPNTATVDPPQGVQDPSPVNNSATRSVAVRVEVDVAVSKAVAPAAAGTGDPVVFEILVTNGGPDIACGVRVQDDFPPGLAAVRWTCEPGGGSSCGRARGEGDLEDEPIVPRGASVTYRATGRVRRTLLATCPQPTELINRATVAAPEGATDRSAGNDSAQARVALLAEADLFITKTDGVEKVMPGDEVTYRIRVGNRGPDAACSARVTDAFPPELTGVTWTCEPSPDAACRADGSGPIADSSVKLPPGGRALYTATGTVAACDEEGFLVNSATVRPPRGRPPVTDPVADNTATDRDACPVPVEPPEMKLEKRLRGSCAEGEEVRYTLVLRNEGEGPQGDNPGDELVDALPEQLTLLDASASSGVLAVDGNAIAWNGAVGPMEEITLELLAEIEAGTLGDSVCNQAFLFEDSDANGVNDTPPIRSDDPRIRPGEQDPTCFVVCPPGAAIIPALSPPALVLLGALLAALGWLALRRAAP